MGWLPSSLPLPWINLNQVGAHLLHLLEDRGAPQLAAVFLVIFFILLYCIIYTSIVLNGGKCWRRKGFCSSSNSWPRKKRVLVAIAHPDDEAMFFGPTIRNLIREGHSVYLLCFSYGDSEGLGLTRKAELWKSTKTLGIPNENVTIVKHDKLKDGMYNRWPVLPLSAHIKSFVHAYDIDVLVTFDDVGVSGHSNHVSVYYAALDLLERNLLPRGCEIFTLKSVGIFRQYFLNLFYVPPAYYFNQFVYISRGRDYDRIVKAMKSHKSQMLWFRHLHVYFSSYMMVNIFEKITNKPKPKYFSSSSGEHRRRKNR